MYTKMYFGICKNVWGFLNPKEVIEKVLSEYDYKAKCSESYPFGAELLNDSIQIIRVYHKSNFDRLRRWKKIEKEIYMRYKMMCSRIVEDRENLLFKLDDMLCSRWDFKHGRITKEFYDSRIEWILNSYSDDNYIGFHEVPALTAFAKAIDASEDPVKTNWIRLALNLSHDYDLLYKG